TATEVRYDRGRMGVRLSCPRGFQERPQENNGVVRVAPAGSPRLVGKPVALRSRLSGIIMASQRGSSVRLDTVRGLVRRTVRRCLGPQGELAAHRLYHRFLRRIDRFSLPESRGNLSALAVVSRQANTILD